MKWGKHGALATLVVLLLLTVLSKYVWAPNSIAIDKDYSFAVELVGFSVNYLDDEDGVKTNERLLRSDRVIELDGNVAVIESVYQGFDN
jgi:hypothetical protein